MSVIRQYAMVLDAQAIGFGVVLNGIPLVQSEPSNRINSTTKITGWLVPGQNVAELRLHALPPPTALPRTPPPAPPPQPEFTILFHEFRAGLGSEGNTDLQRFSYDASISTLPLTRTLSFAASDIPTWAWVRAAAVSPTAADRSEILSLLQGFMTELQARDVATAAERLTPMLHEQAVALGTSADELNASFEQFVMGLSGADDWHVTPLDDAELNLVPIAGGRLQKAERRGRAPAVQARSSNGSYLFEPYLCKLDGKWLIIR